MRPFSFSSSAFSSTTFPSIFVNAVVMASWNEILAREGYWAFLALPTSTDDLNLASSCASAGVVNNAAARAMPDRVLNMAFSSERGDTAIKHPFKRRATLQSGNPAFQLGGSGRTNQNTQPSGLASTPISPECSVTMALQTASSRPVPAKGCVSD